MSRQTEQSDSPQHVSKGSYISKANTLTCRLGLNISKELHAVLFFFWLAKEIMLIWSLAATKTVSRHYIFLFFPENIVFFFFSQTVMNEMRNPICKGKITYLPWVFGQTGQSKQCRPRSDAAICSIWSGSTLFAPIRQYLDKSREQNWHALILEHAMIKS